jgi:glutamate racemase
MTIGVFDSGVGGLWILRNLRQTIPGHNYIYLADQAHVPYGQRTIEEIRDFSDKITQFLINKGCQIIVIACNTASAASLLYLREKYPAIIFVGMEPAIKPATEITKTKKVGVLATPATFQGALYNSVVERFAHDVEIYKDTCPGLVEQIEKREFNTRETKDILEKALRPMLEKNIDTIVLGCTHYPFVISLIKEIIGERIKIIDPTGAIVHRVDELAGEQSSQGSFEVYTTGNTKDLESFLGENIKVEQIKI